MAKIDTLLKKPVRTEEKHPKRAIQWIHYSKLVRSAFQFYGEDNEEVIALADLIYLDGCVLQNLLVRKTDADEYEIIAGHKRTLACKYNVEVRELKQFEFLPCIVVAVSDVRARWQTMSTNRYHPKTQYEIMKEIEDMKYLLENYPEEFPDVDMCGKMVDRLAKEMHMSRSVVSDYQNISHNLIDQGKEAFEKQEIDKSAAVALASLPAEEQKELLDKGNVTHTSVKEYKKTLQEPSLLMIIDVYKVLSPERDTDRISYKEYLLKYCRHRGGSHHGISYSCSPRGIKIGSCIEITWNRFMQLLDAALPLRYQKYEEPLPGQVTIQNVDMEPTEESKDEEKNSSIENEVTDWSRLLDRDNFKQWSLHTCNRFAEEYFYKYPLPDQKSIIVRNYKTESFGREGENETYYLYEEGKHLADCEIDRKELEAYLKENVNAEINKKG